jgi:hypothetical protein
MSLATTAASQLYGMPLQLPVLARALFDLDRLVRPELAETLRLRIARPPDLQTYNLRRLSQPDMLLEG